MSLHGYFLCLNLVEVHGGFYQQASNNYLQYQNYSFMIKEMIIAGCGGFIGTCGRFLVGKWSSGMFHGSFPMGTFAVNLITRVRDKEHHKK